MKNRPNQHLFQISHETWAATDPQTVNTIAEDLKSLDLFRLPYDFVTVRLPLTVTATDQDVSHIWVKERWKDCFEMREDGKYHWVHEGVYFDVELFGEHNVRVFADKPTPMFKPFSFIADRRPNGDALKVCDAEYIKSLLIALLATRNAVKSTKHCALRKYGINPAKNRFDYITTISLPRDLPEDTEHKPTGQKRCPHLRRGHKRDQRHGPKNSYVKSIWIAPIFVNADENFVNQRKAYNVSL